MIIGQPARRSATAGKWATAFRFDRRSGASSTARDTWQFDIVGIYERRRRWREQGQRLLPVRLLQRVAAIRQGPGRHDRRARRPTPGRPDAVAARIDAHFENSPAETKTATERQFVKRLLDQVGNIGSILVSVTAAVFFTMLLVTANTMAQSVQRAHQRNRRPQDPGIQRQDHPDAGVARIAVPDVHAAASWGSCWPGFWRGRRA